MSLGNEFADRTGTPLTPLFKTTPEHLANMKHIDELLNVSEVDLNFGQLLCVEPIEEMNKKPKEELWCLLIYQDEKGIHTEYRRYDLEVCRTVFLYNTKGYWQLMLEEQPGAEGIGVGSLVIFTKNDALIKVWRKGVKGRTGFWTAKGGSLTRGDPVPKDATFIGFIHSNFQRLTGRTIFEAPIPVYEVKCERPLLVDNSRFGDCKFSDAKRPDGFEEIAGFSDLFLGNDGRTLATAGKMFAASSFNLFQTIIEMADMAEVSFDSIADLIQMNDEQRIKLMDEKKLFDNRDQ